MHAVATQHGGAGCSIHNDNECISGLDTTVDLGGLEAEGNPSELMPSNQAKLTALTKEKNELHQWVEAREGQLQKAWTL